MSARSWWHPFHGVVIAVGVVGLLLVVLFVVAFATADRALDLGWDAAPDSADRTVMRVTKTWASGTGERLEVGDRVLSIDGDASVAPVSFWPHFLALRDGDPYRLRIERDGEELDLDMTAGLSRKSKRSTWVALLLRLPFVVLTFTTGLLLGLLRPEYRPARIVAVFSVLFSTATLWAALPAYLLEWRFESSRQVVGVLVFFTNAMAYHLFAVFPTAPKRRSFSIGAFYTAGVLFATWQAIDAWHVLQPMAERVEWFWTAGRLRGTMQGIGNAYWLITLLALPVVLVANYRALEHPADRRRIRWVLVGSVVGLLPTIAYAVTLLANNLNLLSGYFASRSWTELLRGSRYIFMLAIPASITHAILRRRLYDIRFVIRRGLQHLLARRSLQVLMFLPAGLLVLSILAGSTGPLRYLLAWRPAALLLLGLTFAAQWKRAEWLGWLDRRFFRTAYDRHRILTDLIQATSNQDSLPGLLSHVRRQLQEAFAPRGITVLARDLGGSGAFHDTGGRGTRAWDDDLVHAAESCEGPTELATGVADVDAGERSAEATGAGGATRVEARSAASTPSENAEQAGAAATVASRAGSADEAGGGRNGEAANPASDGASQDASAPIRLLVPVRDRSGDVVVVIGLGERMSEEPYSSEDRELCALLARQISIGYENALLKEHVASAARRRDEMLSSLERDGVALLMECPQCGRCFDHDASRCEDDGRELVHTLPVERTIEERYRLDRRIARGGMGAVYEGRDLRLDRAVAVKVLLGRSFGDPTALRRFDGEARALARLRHPNVVAVHDYGVTEIGGAFLVMELLGGESLSRAIERTGGVAPEVAADWIEQLCRGVSAIHAGGIVHRDLKPSNALLVEGEDGEPHGRIVIVDFGLAKLGADGGEPGDPLTASGTVVGTPAYMAPEQLAGESVDARTDVYALAIIAVELMTGCHPSLVDGGVPRAVVGVSQAVALEGPGAAALNLLLARCFATSRSQRPPTVDELRDELVPLVRACGEVRLAAGGRGQADETRAGRRRSEKRKR